MKKRLVVVGNAAHEQDLSREIDGCDFVIRFNQTPHFADNRSGFKTSALCLFGLNPPWETDSYKQLNRTIVQHCETLWVWHPLFIPPLSHFFGIPQDKISVRLDVYRQMDRYAIPESGLMSCPSSGMMVLRFLVNSPSFATYDKYYCGFDWFARTTNSIHQWATEKQQVEAYVRLGLLTPLPLISGAQAPTRPST